MTYHDEIFSEYESPKKTWKQKIVSLKHFPALLWEYFYYGVLGSVKLWGSAVAIIIIIILWSTQAIHSMYYSVLISQETSRYVRHTEMMDFHRKAQKSSETQIQCMRNQMKRIAEGKIVEFGFCKK